MEKVYWYNNNSINISDKITNSIWIEQNKDIK